MRTIVIACGLAAALVLPAGAFANETDQRNAAKECKAERGTDSASREAFEQKYGTNANKSNAFGKCVSAKAREEAAERKAARRAARKKCRGLQRGRAQRKCVAREARKAKAKLDKQDRQAIAQTRNAAKECAAERGTTPESRQAFEQKYGTNRNKRNAFGKCVSSKARAA
jgi:hypothetical protein